jgi:ribonuclease HII
MPPATLPDPKVDRAAARRFGGLVCGVDEVGRGPWAGPVVVAAVVFGAARPPPGIADSKLLAAEEREALFERIVAVADVSLAFAPPALIDAVNIRGATLRAMAQAVAGLACRPAGVLVDGRDVPDGLPCPATALVGGDALSISIAAASIVAKVVRDRLMTDLGRTLPDYGFERHKGYGTPEHASALARHGPTAHHRRSFAPVRAALAGDLLAGLTAAGTAAVPHEAL